MQKGLLMGLDAELDFHVIAETESCEKAKQLIIELNPDVILVDLDTPGGGGIPLTEASRVLAPDIAVVLRVCMTTWRLARKRARQARQPW